MRRFELSDGASNKFWQIELSGTDFTVQWGRIGTNGQTQTKSFDTTAKAQAEHDKLVLEKTKKGYAEVAASGTLTPVAATAKAPKAPVPDPSTLPASVPAVAPPPSSKQAIAPAPTHSPHAAAPVVSGIAWTASILATCAPRYGSTLVPVRVGEPRQLWSRLVKRLDAVRPQITAGLGTAGALVDLMEAVLETFSSATPPTPLDVGTQAAAFTLLAPSTSWNDSSYAGAFIQYWVAASGPEFAFEALRAASNLHELSGSAGNSYELSSIALVPQELAGTGKLWWRSRSGGGWRELRHAVLAAGDAGRASLVARVASWRESLPVLTRLLFTTALEQTDWLQADLAEATANQGQRGAPELVWASLLLLPTIDAFKPAALALGTNTWTMLQNLDDLRFDLLARYGLDAAPYLEELLTEATSGGADRVRSFAEAVALVVSTRIAERFARDLTTKELRATASEYLQAHPEVSFLAVAQQAVGKGPLADASRAVLRGQLATSPGAVAALEASLGPAAKALVAELRADAAVREEAAPSELPEVLRTLPWTRKTRSAAPLPVSVALPKVPPRLLWNEAERQAANPSSTWQQPAPAERAMHLKTIEDVSNGANAGYDTSRAFLRLPDADAVQQFNTVAVEKFTYPTYAATTEALLARHGLAVLPGLLRLAEHEPAAALSALLHVDAPEVAPVAAVALARLKKHRSDALAWLTRLPETAAQGLLAPAIGPAGRARADAEEALRTLARAGHREKIEAVGRSAGAEADAALKAVLDFDSLLVLPKRLPSLPAFFVPGALTRPLLAGRKKALPIESVEALGVMLAMSTLEAPYAGVAAVKAACDARSLSDFAWDLFQAWLIGGAPSKEGWAFTALGLLGSDETARRLTPLVRAWPGEAAHTRAVTGLDVLARIGTDVALMHLHGIAQKLKFKGLQERAKEKIQQVAEVRGLSPEELADRLVPDLGLDDDGSLWLDFGERRFQVVFDESLKPAVVGDDLKKAGELPKPRQTDDAEKSAAAVETWKALKKDAKAIAQGQLLRLELAMCQQRRWSTAVFRQFLLEHPLLVHLVRRLVWGVYDAGDVLRASFRVAEDGSFASEKDDTLELPDDAQIGIVHRLELSDTHAGAWGQVFGDYEILQPFEQLARSFHKPGPGESEATGTDRVKGLDIPTGKVLGLDARGWRRGPPQDGGVVCWYEKSVAAGHISLDLEPGIYTGMVSESPRQKLGSVTLSKDSGGYWGKDSRLPLGRLNAVAYSELVRDLESLREQ